jgi:hypothetical protein
MSGTDVDGVSIARAEKSLLDGPSIVEVAEIEVGLVLAEPRESGEQRIGAEAIPLLVGLF